MERERSFVRDRCCPLILYEVAALAGLDWAIGEKGVNDGEEAKPSKVRMLGRINARDSPSSSPPSPNLLLYE